MEQALIKFLIKVLDEDSDRLSWEHLCYAPRELYLKFIRDLDLDRFQMADFVSQWAKQDFNVDLPMTTKKDIAILKELVFDKYRSVYPHLVREYKTDRQGWLRIWTTNHMERDLKRYDSRKIQ